MNKIFNTFSRLLIISLLFCIILKINITNNLENQSIFLSINFLCIILWSVSHNYLIYKNMTLITIFYIYSFIILFFTEYIDSVLKLNIVYGNFEHCQEIKKIGTIFGVPIIVIIGIIPLQYLSIITTDCLFSNKKNIFYKCLFNSILFSIFDIIIETVAINAKLYEFENGYNLFFNIPLHNIVGRFFIDTSIFIIYRIIENKISKKERDRKDKEFIKIYTLLIFYMFNIWYINQIKYVSLKIVAIIYLLVILLIFKKMKIRK